MGASIRWELQDSAQETTDSEVLVQGPAGPPHPKGSHLGPYPKSSFPLRDLVIQPFI